MLMGIKIPKEGHKKLTNKKARIIAHLIGDGAHYKNKTNYSMKYEVSDEELLNSFHEDLYNTYGLKPSWYWNTSGKTGKKIRFVNLNSKIVFEDLLRYSTYFSKNWKIKKLILKSRKQIKKEFLKAIYDDEGSIFKVKGKPILRLYSINLNGLKQIQKMLIEFNLQSKITPGYGLKRNVHGLIIKDIKKFYNQLGFNLKRKQDRLKNYLATS